MSESQPTWNKRAEDFADDTTMYEPSREYRYLIGEGAEWQRKQLSSYEEVERVAEVIAEVTGEPRAGRFERTVARAVIAKQMRLPNHSTHHAGCGCV